MKNGFNFSSDMHRKIGVFFWIVYYYNNFLIYESNCKLKNKVSHKTYISNSCFSTLGSLIVVSFPIIFYCFYTESGTNPGSSDKYTYWRGSGSRKAEKEVKF